MKVQGIIKGDYRTGYWLVSEAGKKFSKLKELLNHYQKKGVTILGKEFSGKVYIFQKGKWQIKSQLDLWE